MCAATAMAIYGIEKVTPERAYEMGLLFFRNIGLVVTASGYYKYRKDRSEEDIDFVEVPLADLKDEIQAKNATSFRLYCENNSGELWDASFGFSTTDFGGFYHFDAQCVLPYFEKEKFIAFIEVLCESRELEYAIFYQVDDVSEGFYYAEGENLVSVYGYENPNSFSRETGGRFKGAERYRNKMLRMVYLVNVVNEGHLGLDVEGVILRDWILSDERHGTLNANASGMWIWEVEEKDLAYVNKILGESGVLISWKPSRPSKVSRFLP
ncbi:hypothetical protein GPJ81_10585 [Pseudomonas alkylphenolica]|uniref:Uncharacterized protein n=1 Tax=Pseudomonas alkylphenolica TaxID=237609 RepID=A0A6I6HBQ0_9PSED|nr:hypothetical protein [Pseudomonas alkylphenolica]QGW77105.1 hypothetical protein GPJ81_10585 [Pseudomonas alkylphenolica]